MATFSQEAKRLVLVAPTSDAYEKLTANIPAGGIGFRGGNGSAITSTDIANQDPASVQIILKDADGAEALHSEIIEKSWIDKISHKAYEAPYEAVSLLRFGAGTYDMGQEVVVGIRFDGYGSLSMKNPYTKHGAYYVTANDTASSTVVAALVANLNKNLDKDLVPRATAIQGGADDVAGDLGALTLSVTNGSSKVELSATGATPGAGWCLIAGNLVYLTYNATVDAFLDRPYQGATAAGLSVTNLTTADLLIVGDPQSKINFEHMMNKAVFVVRATVDSEADSNVTITEFGSSIGVGYGPHVANIEKFANESLNRDQFAGADYHRYNAPLYTDPSINYDVVSVKIATTKTGMGSNVTSFREIDIFVNAASSSKKAIILANDLSSWSGVSVL